MSLKNAHPGGTGGRGGSGRIGGAGGDGHGPELEMGAAAHLRISGTPLYAINQIFSYTPQEALVVLAG
jgi:hypothetical protein